LTAEQGGDSEYEYVIELDYGHTRSHVEARYANLRRWHLELETQQEYYEVTCTPSALKIGFPPPKLRKKPRSFEDLEQLSRNVELACDVLRKKPINVMLRLFAESLKKGTVVEPLCSAEEALVTARTIDDTKKTAHYRLAEKP
jgi:hypothetical protein